MRAAYYSVFAMSVVLAAMPAAAQRPMSDFARYEVILKRQPFGKPQERNAGPKPPPVKQEDPFKNYRLVGLTKGDDEGISVGIVDIGSKPNYTMFMEIGDEDSISGIKLVDADFELEAALVRKGPYEKWLRMGGSSGGVGGSAGNASAGGASGDSKVNTQTEKGFQSYVERMRARRAARHRTVEPPKLEGEALKKHLSEYNMELIRAAAKGESKGPPLPIQLTPEQDAQLVKEGVLPPQE